MAGRLRLYNSNARVLGKVVKENSYSKDFVAAVVNKNGCSAAEIKAET